MAPLLRAGRQRDRFPGDERQKGISSVCRAGRLRLSQDRDESPWVVGLCVVGGGWGWGLGPWAGAQTVGGRSAGELTISTPITVEVVDTYPLCLCISGTLIWWD